VRDDDLALPTATPSEVGVDAAGVTAFLDTLAAAPDQELHSLALLRHGRVYAQGWWAPYTPDDRTLLYSLSKSFTSTALGFAVAEGRLALTDRLVDRIAPRGEVGPRTAALTLRDLASMATGHHEDTLERAYRADPHDTVQGFLTLDPESDPGSVFCYNNGATHALAAVVQEVTGETLTDYLRPRLFEPLGVDPGPWDQHPAGREIGFSGLHLTTEALARFGQLYLSGGSYAGRQVLPEGWAALATSLHTPNPAEPNPDWRQGYGFQFWRGRHGTIRGDGAYGQFVVLLPEQDAVLVTTGATANMQGVLDAAWAHLLPAFDAAGSAEADAALADRLAGQTIRTDRPDPLGDVAVPPVGADGRGLAVGGVEETTDGWVLRLAENGDELVVPVARDGWLRSDLAVRDGRGALVASRAEADADGLAVDVVFLETPHRLRAWITSDASTLTWHTAPLGFPSVAQLATPR